VKSGLEGGGEWEELWGDDGGKVRGEGRGSREGEDKGEGLGGGKERQEVVGGKEIQWGNSGEGVARILERWGELEWYRR